MVRTVLVTGGSGFVGSHVIVQLLQAGFNVHATLRSLARVPARRLPNVIARLIALGSSEMRALTPLLGKARSATSAKAQRLLGWTPRPWEDEVVATAESLFQLGIVAAPSRRSASAGS